MLTEKQLEEIKGWLHKSQNPLFFFDNDIDGLSSFLLLRRYINTGKGVAIKSFPALSAAYARKLHELKPDVVFILDKPMVEDAFMESCRQLGLPVIWIDHHPVQKTGENVYYYNPMAGKKKTNEPISYLCYKITKKDEWIAMLGCVSDCFLPEFSKEFESKYSDIFSLRENPLEIIYETEYGKLIRMLSFALKDTTSNVVKMLKVLIDAGSPYEILKGGGKFEDIYKRYLFVNKKYGDLLERARAKAENEKDKKLFYFEYGGELSLSADLANEMLYLLKDKKAIAIAYIKDLKVNFSLRARGKIDMRKIVKKAIEGLDGRGGGHKYACGATITTEQLEKFKNNLAKALKSKV